MGRVRIGLSGWSYDEWRGSFYPPTLRRGDELAYAAAHVDTLEINRTFYGLATPRVFEAWAAAVPSDFVFAVKGSRFITHVEHLHDTGTALANFFASGVLELDRHLGPILWQLPARLHFDADRMDRFLALLPHDTDSAVRLARRHDERVAEVGYGPGGRHRVRHVLEVRHESYRCEQMAAIARRHGVAIAASHSTRWPVVEEVTAGFVYVRLHGPDELYASGYDEAQLRAWADRVQVWHAGGQPDDAARISELRPPRRLGRDVFVYFDNDVHGHAPRDAARLRELVA